MHTLGAHPSRFLSVTIMMYMCVCASVMFLIMIIMMFLCVRICHVSLPMTIIMMSKNYIIGNKVGSLKIIYEMGREMIPHIIYLVSKWNYLALSPKNIFRSKKKIKELKNIKMFKNMKSQKFQKSHKFQKYKCLK